VQARNTNNKTDTGPRGAFNVLKGFLNIFKEEKMTHMVAPPKASPAEMQLETSK
jgi:hypothetical protein